MSNIEIEVRTEQVSVETGYGVIRERAREYGGEYNVVPSYETIRLATKNRLMTEDVTVSEVPTNVDEQLVADKLGEHDSDTSAHADIRAALDAKADLIDGKVPASQLPEYVDDVLEYDSMADFPPDGAEGVLYIDRSTGYGYRGSVSGYVMVFGDAQTLGGRQSDYYAPASALSAKYDLPRDGIPKTDLAQAVRDSLDLADSALQSVPDATASVKGVTKVGASGGAAAYDHTHDYYAKPFGGIPKADLSSGVQTSLDKADSALQSVPDATASVKGIMKLGASGGAAEYEHTHGYYTKPLGGIPVADLSSVVQTSLDKADSALQSVPDATASVKGIMKLGASGGAAAYDHTHGYYTNPSGGIPRADLAAAVRNSLDLADSALQSVPDATASVKGITTVGASGGAAAYGHTHGYYTKPSGGIPKADLAAAVQTSLGKADSALQSVPDATASVKGIVKLGASGGAATFEHNHSAFTKAAVNLLDNADWGYSLVNQRGASSYTGSAGGVYGIDRWMIMSAHTVTVSAPSGTTPGYVRLLSGCVIKQRMELAPSEIAGKQCCFSILRVNGNLQSGSITFPAATNATAALTLPGCSITVGYDSGTFQINGVTESAVPYIMITASVDINVERVMLELGSYSHLSATPALSYALNMAVCNRYLYRVPSQSRFVRCANISVNTLYFDLPLPSPMRTAPSLVTSGNSMTDIKSFGGTAETGFEITVSSIFPFSSVRINASKESHGLADATLNIANVLLSAEL